MRPLGRPAEPNLAKPGYVLNKHLIDDMADFHGFITPGNKFTNERLDDECSTALPSQCSSAGSLESLPPTPAGLGAPVFGLPTTPAGLGWQPGAPTWRPGISSLDPGSSLPLGFDSDLDASLASFLNGVIGMDPSGMESSVDPWGFRPSDSELSAFEPSLFEPSISEAKPSACEHESQPSLAHLATPEMISPPLTPRLEPRAQGTCPLAPAEMSYPTLMRALQKNNLEMVMMALEADPESAHLPFWDHNVEPPLCTAIRLGCRVDIVEFLVKSDADVKARDSAGQSPLELLFSTTWRSAASSKEIEEVLIGAGAEPLENSAKMPHSEKAANYMFGWDCVGSTSNSITGPYDFGLPPSLDSFHAFDDLALIDVEPPPPL